LYLVFRRFCLVNETYQNLPRITTEAELLPRYKMGTLANDRQTYEELNKKILTLKKTDAIDIIID